MEPGLDRVPFISMGKYRINTYREARYPNLRLQDHSVLPSEMDKTWTYGT